MAHENQTAVPPMFIVKTVQAMQNKLVHMSQKMAPPFVHVMDMAAGGMKAKIINLAAELELADHLKDGEKTSAELAKTLDCDESTLYRLLRALAAFEIFKETAPRTFATTEYGQTLEKDREGSLHSLALLVEDVTWKESWQNLVHSIKTGKGSFHEVFGQSYFDYLQSHQDKAELFYHWMDQISDMNCPIVAGSFPFSRYDTVVDIGGGYGALLTYILKAHHSVKGILYDVPDVIDALPEMDESIKDRFSARAGSFFDSVPQGADLYIMQQIIHDWSDEMAITILTNCQKAMTKTGRVLIVDAVIAEDNKFDINKLIDLQMLALTDGGRERTESEFKALLLKSGLELVKVHPTAAMFNIVEARKL